MPLVKAIPCIVVPNRMPVNAAPPVVAFASSGLVEPRFRPTEGISCSNDSSAAPTTGGFTGPVPWRPRSGRTTPPSRNHVTDEERTARRDGPCTTPAPRRTSHGAGDGLRAGGRPRAPAGRVRRHQLGRELLRLARDDRRGDAAHGAARRPPAPSIGLTVTESEVRSAPTRSALLGGIALLVALIVAYYAGGYVAGRMSRFDGAPPGHGHLGDRPRRDRRAGRRWA